MNFLECGRLMQLSAELGAGEDVAIGVAAVELRILGLAVLAPGVEDFDGARVEVDRSSGGAGLASRCVEFVADRHERACDGQLRGVEVDVALAESEDLAASHASVGGDPQRGVVGRPEEIASAVLWLCSDLGGFAIGHALVIDGGQTVGI